MAYKSNKILIPPPVTQEERVIDGLGEHEQLPGHPPTLLNEHISGCTLNHVEHVGTTANQQRRERERDQKKKTRRKKHSFLESEPRDNERG